MVRNRCKLVFSGVLEEKKQQMTTVSSLCVFCGSKTGDDPAHELAARRLGEIMAERNVTLVFGGGRIGLMGVVARAVLVAAQVLTPARSARCPRSTGRNPIDSSTSRTCSLSY